MPQNDFNFSTEPVEFGPFNIGNKQCVLTEASEAGHTAYKNTAQKGLSMKEIGEARSVTVDGGAEADAVLIAGCLWEVTGDTRKLLGVQFVQKLPRRITKKLYEKVREISGMVEEEETLEFLEARITSDTAKVKKLRKDDGPAKNE